MAENTISMDNVRLSLRHGLILTSTDLLADSSLPPHNPRFRWYHRSQAQLDQEPYLQRLSCRADDEQPVLHCISYHVRRWSK